MEFAALATVLVAGEAWLGAAPHRKLASNTLAFMCSLTHIAESSYRMVCMHTMYDVHMNLSSDVLATYKSRRMQG